MGDTSQVKIVLEDSNPNAAVAPVPPAEGTMAPPDLTSAGNSSQAPAPPVPTEGVLKTPPENVPSAPQLAPAVPAPDAAGTGKPVASQATAATLVVGDEDPGLLSKLWETGSDAVPVLRAALVAATVSIEVLTSTVQALDDSFQEMAERGGEYNADIAGANAVADLRLTLAEMRRANELSEELAGYMDERSQLSVDIKDAVTELARVGLPIAKEVVKDLRPLVRGVEKLLGLASLTELNSRKTAFILETMSAALLPGVSGAVNFLKSIDANIADKERTSLGGFANELRDFLNPATSRVDAVGEARAADRIPNRHLVFPAFRP